MAFSFNFASDDIEYDDVEDAVNTGVENLSINDESDGPQLFEAKSLSIDEMVRSRRIECCELSLMKSIAIVSTIYVIL